MFEGRSPHLDIVDTYKLLTFTGDGVPTRDGGVAGGSPAHALVPLPCSKGTARRGMSGKAGASRRETPTASHQVPGHRRDATKRKAKPRHCQREIGFLRNKFLKREFEGRSPHLDIADTYKLLTFTEDSVPTREGGRGGFSPAHALVPLPCSKGTARRGMSGKLAPRARKTLRRRRKNPTAKQQRPPLFLFCAPCRGVVCHPQY